MATPLEIVHGFYEAFEKSDLEGLLALMHPSFVMEIPELPGTPLRSRYEGHEGFRTFWSDRAGSIEYTVYAPKHFLESDGVAVVVGRTEGLVHPGAHPFAFEWAQIFEVTHDKVLHFRELLDGRSLCAAFAVAGDA